MTNKSGFLLIDKPAGPTSHDIVDRVRRLTGEHTVGHAGTLDPFATGLLIVGVGREATKHLSTFLGLDKTYEAMFVFGASSDTDDRTGVITSPSPHPSLAGGETQAGWETKKETRVPLPRGTSGGEPTTEQIRAVLPQFIGQIEQVPPAFAAIKIKGQKMYVAARAGKPLAAPPRKITVYEFSLLPELAFAPLLTKKGDGEVAVADEPHLTSPWKGGETRMTGLRSGNNVFRFRIHCSSGTYIRALARDLGKKLGTAAYVSELRRTAIGPFPVSEAKTLDQLASETVEHFLIPINLLQKFL